MTIRAIETSYKGYRFRSRLEARWAVFFDALGIEWVYEPEGFDFGDGLRYLPDFKLVDWDIYIEIKPSLPSRDELIKILRLAKEIGELRKPDPPKTQVMLCGTPGLPLVRFDAKGMNVGGGYVALTTSGISVLGLPVVSLEAFAMCNGGKSLDIWPIYLEIENGFIPIKSSNGGLTISPVNVMRGSYGALTLFHGIIKRWYDGDGVQYDTSNIQQAYESARSARFEHGETPKVPRGKPKK